ncbi:uroporphyrinogen-III decarboxylase [Pelomyxa schiedti]|nr:uroporphyrinogen-III decarboxylase [Pelomyxa schiedti]
MFGVDTIELGRGFALQDRWWQDWTLPDSTPCQVPVWAVPTKNASTGCWCLNSTGGTVVGTMPQGGFYFEQCNFPLAQAEHPISPSRVLDAMAECMWCCIGCPPSSVELLSQSTEGQVVLREGAQSLRTQQGEKAAIIGLFGGSLFEVGQYLFGSEKFMSMMASEKKECHAFLETLTDIHMAALEKFLSTVSDHIPGLNFPYLYCR